MRLLFVTSIVPDGGLGSGYEIANAAIIDALRRAGLHVTVMGFTWPGKAPLDPQNAIVLGSVDVRTENASLIQRLAWLAKAVPRKLTFSSVKLAVRTSQEVRTAIERAGPFDAYMLNSVQLAGAFEEVFRELPFVLVAHNVEHRSAQENARAAPGVAQRLLFRREAGLLEKLEARLCARARFVFTLAEEDCAALGVPPQKCVALPLVTRPAPPAKAPRRIAYDAALVGTWTWQPNRIGLDWFLGKVVPHLPPAFRIGIAGAVPAGVSCVHPGVEFVGRVPDAQAFVRGGAVIPLISTAGSGVQLKTIETFELGLPSVATSHSLRGIGWRPANCTVTDDPVAFAGALQVAAARGVAADTDGAAFHQAQSKALDKALGQGLRAAGFVSEQEICL